MASPSPTPAATPGLAYWRPLLAPYARAGYTRGLLDPLEVVLVNEVDEVHIPRPSGWSRADLLVRELEGDDIDPDDPARRGVVYLMRSPTGDRMELSV
jgi:hypothetical protein